MPQPDSIVSDCPERGRSVGPWLRRHGPRFLLSGRLVVAAVITFGASHALGFAQSYWAVLTTVIVLQSSVGGSLTASIDRLVGSLVGAVWGVLVCIWVPHHGVLTLGLALAVAMAPLAVAVAFRPAWRVAPVTAIILLLTPASQAEGPVAAALQRMLEVGLGSVVAVAVAMALAPRRARADLSEAARRALERMADLTTVLMAGLASARRPGDVEDAHAGIRRAIGEAEAAAAEAGRERIITLGVAFDPVPFCRALRRAHHDLVMLGRLTVAPLPPETALAMTGPSADVGRTVAACFRAQSEAVVERAPPPSMDLVAEAAMGLTKAVRRLRTDGVSRSLSDDGLARLFGLAFVVDQLGQDIGQLTDRIAELRRRT